MGIRLLIYERADDHRSPPTSACCVVCLRRHYTNSIFELTAQSTIGIEKPLQEQLLKAIEQQACVPSLSQARRLRGAAENSKLDFNGMVLVLSEEKPIERKVVLSGERFDRLIPNDYTPRQKENYVLEALAYYQQHREAQRQIQDRELTR